MLAQLSAEFHTKEIKKRGRKAKLKETKERMKIEEI
jgi:hypothetical protein